MTFKTDDRVYETSVTTGTGDYTLDGAVVGFTTFAGMGANNLCPYFATDDTNWEVGIGTILTGPARLQRTTVLRSSNADAAVNWAAGTRKLRCGLPAAMAIPRALSKSVAGNVDVALTQDEQRRDVLVFTGALTGNINVTVDTTQWEWTVFNNTSGAYSLTFKTTAGTGKAVTQGKGTRLRCDGTNVVDAIDSLSSLAVSGIALVGTATDGGGAGSAAFQATLDGSAASKHAAVLITGLTGYYGAYVWNKDTAGDNTFLSFLTNGGTGTPRGSIDYNRAGGAVRFNTTSDATLKTLLGDADLSVSTGILKSTRLRKYFWNDDPKQKPQISPLAQELRETFPGAVSVGGMRDVLDDEGVKTGERYQPWGIDKTAYTFHLVAGWQQHESELQALREEVQAMRQVLNGLTQS